MARAERYTAKSVEASSSIVISTEYTMARCVKELNEIEDVWMSLTRWRWKNLKMLIIEKHF